jgi:HK97 family phage portal protein
MGVRLWAGKLLGRAGLRVAGKALASEPEHGWGGWEALTGTIAMKKSGDIWKTFTEADLLALQKRHAVIFACIDAISSRIPEADLVVGKEGTNGWEVDTKHPLNRVLKAPNPMMDQADLEVFTAANLLSSGEAYLWKLRNGLGEVAEIWPIPAAWATPKWTRKSDKPISHFEVKTAKGKKTFDIPPEDVVFIRNVDPANIYASLSPMNAALRDVQTDEGRQDYVIEMLTNLKVPGLVIKSGKTALSPKQRKALRTELEDLIGATKRGSPLLIEGEGAGVEAVAPLKDLDWPGLADMSEARICAVFKVPPILIGMRVGLNRSTFANYQEAVRSFYRGTMSPFWKRLAAAMTRGLIITEEGEADKDLELRFDTSNVEQLQEEATVRADRAVKLFHAGVITLGEAAEMAGVDKPEEDDTAGMRVLPMSLIRIDEEVVDTTNTLPPEEPDADEDEDTGGGEGDTDADQDKGGGGDDEGDDEGEGE